MRDPIRILLWAGALAIAGATVLGLADRLMVDGWVGWVMDLLSHWPKHLFLAGIVIGALAAG